MNSFDPFLSGFGQREFPSEFFRPRMNSGKNPFPDSGPSSGSENPPIAPPNDGPSIWCILKGIILPFDCALDKDYMKWFAAIFDALVELLLWDLECALEVFQYLRCKVTEWILKVRGDPSRSECLEPNMIIMAVGGVTLLALTAMVTAVLYFGGEPIIQLGTSIMGYILTFVFDLASYLRPVLGNFFYAAKTGLYYAYELCEFMARETYSNPGLWLMVTGTALLWGALQVVIEVLNGTLRFKGTKIYDVWRVVSYPIRWILDEIGDLFGRGIIYWIAEIVALPFQSTAFLLSIFLAMICEIFDELIDLIKDKSQQD